MFLLTQKNTKNSKFNVALFGARHFFQVLCLDKCLIFNKCY
jgi:hypothetical protein